MQVNLIKLPSHWKSCYLEDIAEIHNNLRKPVNASERKKRVGPYPYYGATGQVGWIDDFRQDGEFVLLGEDGAPFLDLVKEKAYIVTGKCWVNNHAHVLKGKDGICLNKYLLYSLNQTNFNGLVNGTTRLKLTQASLRKIPVNLAPFKEQQLIVAKIEELFSELDSGIASLKTAQQQLKIYRQSLLKHAFEGKLTEQWRKDNADKFETPEQLLARIQTERETRYQQQLDEWKQAVKEWEAKGKEGKKPSKPKRLSILKEVAGNGLVELSNLPVAWNYVRLGLLIDEPTYGTSAKCSYESEGVGVLRIPNIINGVVDDNDLKFARFDTGEVDHLALKKGDLLTIRSNGSISLVGTCAIIKEKDVKHIFAGYLIRLRPNQKLILPSFLLAAMSSYILRQQIERAAKSTSGVNNINSGELQNLIIPIASIEEQKEIVNKLEEKLSIIEQNEKEIESALAKAELLRQSILKKAFSGKLSS